MKNKEENTVDVNEIYVDYTEIIVTK